MSGCRSLTMIQPSSDGVERYDPPLVVLSPFDICLLRPSFDYEVEFTNTQHKQRQRWELRLRSSLHLAASHNDALNSMSGSWWIASGANEFLRFNCTTFLQIDDAGKAPCLKHNRRPSGLRYHHSNNAAIKTTGCGYDHRHAGTVSS